MARGSYVKFRSRLPEIARELPIRGQELAMELANVTAEKAQDRARSQYEGSDPFEIRAKRMESGDWISARTARTGSSRTPGGGVYAAWYWFFGEFGTTKQPAKPYMIPALREAYLQVHPRARKVFRKLERRGVRL